MSLYKVDNGDGTYEMVEYVEKHEHPPNIEAVAEKFPLKGREIFAFDGVIYNPSGCKLPPELIEHEKIHFRQQGGNPEVWWLRYLGDDDQWRYEQELEAHIVEYKVFCQHNRDRNKQVKYLHLIARRLSSPMYGKVATFSQAMKEIRNG